MPSTELTSVSADDIIEAEAIIAAPRLLADSSKESDLARGRRELAKDIQKSLARISRNSNYYEALKQGQTEEEAADLRETVKPVFPQGIEQGSREEFRHIEAIITSVTEELKQRTLQAQSNGKKETNNANTNGESEGTVTLRTAKFLNVVSDGRSWRVEIEGTNFRGNKGDTVIIRPPTKRESKKLQSGNKGNAIFVRMS